jgi:tartrate dehydratase alpha subunit/fumarate hydratase class I-like protein
MVDISVELIKSELTETLSVSGLNFDQMHYIVKKAVKEISLLRNDDYNKTIEKFYIKNNELEKEKAGHVKEIIDINGQISNNDKKIYEAIQKL